MWIQTGVRVRKRLSWVLTSVTLTFDFWPWPFAWTSLLTMVITPENFMMIRWWEHGEKGVTDGRTDGQTDGQTENTICRAAWSQLKKRQQKLMNYSQRNVLLCPYWSYRFKYDLSYPVLQYHCVLYALTQSKTCFFSPQAKFTAKTYNIVDNGQQCCGIMVIFQSKYVAIFLLID